MALAELEDSGPEAAVEAITKGLAQLKQCYLDNGVDEEQVDEDELVERLDELGESVREHYHLGRTLAEQLAEAVAAEEFERAAQLRDEIAKRTEESRVAAIRLAPVNSVDVSPPCSRSTYGFRSGGLRNLWPMADVACLAPLGDNRASRAMIGLGPHPPRTS